VLHGSDEKTTMTFDEYNNSLEKPHSFRSLSYFAAKGAWEDGVKIGMAADTPEEIPQELYNEWLKQCSCCYVCSGRPCDGVDSDS
jgi:hypothetical protein